MERLGGTPTEHITLSNIWAVVAAIAAAVVLLVNAAEKIVSVIHAAKAPNAAQDNRLAALEENMTQVKSYLANDKKRIDGLAEGDKVTKHSLLALLNHGIDGNNVTQMESAKHELEEYLINR